MTPPKDGKPEISQDPGWVHEVLEPDQLSSSGVKYPLKKLNPATLVILWAMRGYVIFMLILIAVYVWRVLHAGGKQ